jgi:hypothetical protein
MPPFQGGAFNHSATCPDSLRGRNLAVLRRPVNAVWKGEMKVCTAVGSTLLMALGAAGWGGGRSPWHAVTFNRSTY